MNMQRKPAWMQLKPDRNGINTIIRMSIGKAGVSYFKHGAHVNTPFVCIRLNVTNVMIRPLIIMDFIAIDRKISAAD